LQTKGIDADRVIEQWVNIGFANRAEAFDPETKQLKDVDKLPMALQQAINGFDCDAEGHITKIRFEPQTEATKLVGMYFNLLKGKGENVPEEIGVIMYPSNGKDHPKEGDK
jgi:hypothetical protein